jgi:hypothetical protein
LHNKNTFRESIAQILLSLALKKFENRKKNEAQEVLLVIIFPFEVFKGANFILFLNPFFL